MKKIFALFIGIVFLISCTCRNNHGTIVSNKDKKRVIIYLRSIELNGEKHLAMFDSNRRWAIDTLTTEVLEGGTVFWKFERISGIREITKISSKPGRSNVYKINPKPRLLGKGYRLKLSNDSGEGIKEAIEEEYYIEYIDGDSKPVKIDPYIRILPN